MIQQPSSYFPRTPARMRCAHPNHRFRYSLAHAMRTIVRRVATLLKPDNSLIVITFEPFVTSLPADLVTAAKLRNAQFVTQIVRDEHYPLVHGTGLFPRHEIPPSCQPVTHHPGLLCYLSSRFEPTFLPLKGGGCERRYARAGGGQILNLRFELNANGSR